ncbi:hypothetical protein CUMW_244800 [Citrus unshiu]|nr:hypothetical protein CUMW_244800 [Citrus unshiu]
MPKGIGKLTSLLTLGSFVVGKDGGSGLRELKSLVHLQGTLEISRLENVKGVGDASEVQLNSKVNLKALSLQWGVRYYTFGSHYSFRDAVEPKTETQVIDMLKPHQKLEELTITGYGGTLPERLLLLEKLNIFRCEQLLVTLQCLPALRELEIDGCKGVVLSSPIDLSSLKLVHSGDMAKEVFEQRLPKLERLEIQHSETRLLQDIRSLNRLQISRCPQLLSLVTEEEHDQQQPELPCRLQFLELCNCEGLTRLPQALLTLSSQLRTIKIEDCNALESLLEAWMYNSNSSLESLKIRSCNSLVSFPDFALPSRLRTVTIEGCDALESLPEAWMQNSSTSLEREQDIRGSSSGCTCLTSFSSENELPATLEHLEVSSCSNLAFLSRNGNLPQALKYLKIRDCSKLESLAERVDGWPNLESFPEEGLPSTKLTELMIWSCENLKALPNSMHNLTSLLHLEIGRCPSLVSFPEDGFPTNLQSLEFEDLKISKPFFQWGLNRFNSLRKLKISGGCPDLVSSPRFPASLTELKISDMPSLERLSSIGENLTSLKFLDLDNCPKLKYFSKQGLPKSLLRLIIDECPLIEKRCRTDKGKYWPMITHIPCVRY